MAAWAAIPVRPFFLAIASQLRSRKWEHRSRTPSESFAILARMASAPKKLFLVDAMAHIYRAFFAPMNRMNAPSGIPTKVPFLFANILRRLIKDYEPDYLGIVFDTKGPTFRDKLFEKYKAQRPPMPDDLSVQIPYVRTLCTGSGGAKADIIVDAKKVEEILGVPPEKVIDLMALLGDTVDNIPGAKGIGEKGATELIQKYGSVESALDHADEVTNKRYREALQQQREQVMMSKQLATIKEDVPLEVDLEKLQVRAADPAALAELYRELGFNSLLKELLASGVGVEAGKPGEDSRATVAGEKKDYAQLANVEEFKAYLKKLPAKAEL